MSWSTLGYWTLILVYIHLAMNWLTLGYWTLIQVYSPGYELVNPGVLDPDTVHHVQQVLGVHGQHVRRGQHASDTSEETFSRGKSTATQTAVSWIGIRIQIGSVFAICYTDPCSEYGRTGWQKIRHLNAELSSCVIFVTEGYSDIFEMWAYFL